MHNTGKDSQEAQIQRLQKRITRETRKGKALIAFTGASALMFACGVLGTLGVYTSEKITQAPAEGAILTAPSPDAANIMTATTGIGGMGLGLMFMGAAGTGFVGQRRRKWQKQRHNVTVTYCRDMISPKPKS